MSNSSTAQATWGGRFQESPSALMLHFSESVSFDYQLAPYDLLCSLAHSAMLESVGILTHEEKEAIHQGLYDLGKKIRAGQFTWKQELEDVHMNLEQALTEAVPAAAKLHTARSRNDQVATDLRLYFKDTSRQLIAGLKQTISALLDLAEKSQDVWIPGYTHLQRGQPVSVAHHLLAYVEMLRRDVQRFCQVWQQANWCPLGSGALAGTTLPIDREFSARWLGFTDSEGKPQVTRNSMDAVSDRDVHLDFAHACSLVALHLSRLSEDVILWNSSEFGFVRLPDAFTTGSSLMPQKKNPDSFELVRGKTGRIIGNQQALAVMVKGLPLTYNRDLQEDKPPLFDSHKQVSDCLQVVSSSLQGFEWNRKRCEQAVSDPLLLATDLADELVRKGVAFRQAHHVIGHLVGRAEALNCPLDQLPESERPEELRENWESLFRLKEAMGRRERPGMPGPASVASRIQEARDFIAARLPEEQYGQLPELP